MRKPSTFPPVLLLAGLAIAGCREHNPGTTPADVAAETAADVTEADPDAAVVETSEDGASEVDTGPPPPCIPEPPPEALLKAGETLAGGGRVMIGTRKVDPAGPNIVVEGFPTQVIAHPTLPVAYVASTSRDDRRLLVLDLAGAGPTIRQDVARDEAFYGLTLSPDGARAYASGGSDNVVEYYDVDAVTGELTRVGEVAVPNYPSGLAVSGDGARLWVGQYDGRDLVEFDTATMTEVRTINTGHHAWDVVYVPGVEALYVSELHGDRISAVSIASGAVDHVVEVSTSPAGMAVAPDGGTVWVAVSGGDVVAQIDTATGQVTATAAVAEADLVDDTGAPLGNSNVNDLAYDAASQRLYVSRGADNAVSVLDATSLVVLGAFPVSLYPTSVALTPDGARLVVAEGKGGGSGPNDGQGAKERLKGSVTVATLADQDLAVTTQQVSDNFHHPQLVFPFDCPSGNFPIPTRPEHDSPIEHVVLIVKENKTFDCVFSDLGGDITADTEHLRWDETITPNQHALARAYAISDNFYSEAPNSDTGHLFLTATHLTEHIERLWIEQTRSGGFTGYQIEASATPSKGNFFSHLLDNDVSIRIFGEIVGMFALDKNGQEVINHSDAGYPGGPFVNYGVKDVVKAQHIIDAYTALDALPQFTYVSLPNDHGEGTDPGKPTPESHVADNDEAVGMLVDWFSQQPTWDKTAVFIVEDDPQGCSDSVDAHRTFLIVASPWAKRGYVSHVNASFISIFATIERILGVGPIARPDAAASPLWDMFTAEADASPYAKLDRLVPIAVNPPDAPGAAASKAMDFSGPDRNLYLGVVLDAYRLWKMGRITRAEAEARIATPKLAADLLEELDEEVEEETFAFDKAMKQYDAWRAKRGLPPAKRHR